ncbi:MAG: hypothetical protein K2W85_12840 [Phycisphaerales bacterium]|nr:hypothetical protein [Phycisphaerales bacterium]
MLTHRQIAKRKAARWQVGAVALALGAGAAIALPLHKQLTPAAPATAAIPTPPAPPDRGAELSKLNFSQTASTLKMLGPVVVASAATPEPTLDPSATAAANPTPAAPAPGEWVYVGHLSTPTTRTAMLRIGGEQKLFAIGTKYQESTVKVIEPTYVEIDQQGTIKRLELAQRTMDFPSDGPKKPVPVRGPQAGGQAPMAMTQPQGGGMGQPMAPNSFDQARIAALEQARRAQMASEKGMSVPDRPSMENAAAMKRLINPNAGLEERISALREFGISSGMTYEEAASRIKTLSGDRADDILKINDEAILENANGKREAGE